jgi:hypothetical protein
MKNDFSETCDFVRLACDSKWRPARLGKTAGGTEGIYGLVDPREPKRIRYVGSSDCIERRLYAHAHSNDPKVNNPRFLWLRSLRADGVKPVAVVLEQCAVGETGSKARHTREARWIELLACVGQADLNARLVDDYQHPDALRELQAENEALRRQVAALQREVERLTSTEDLV